MNWPPPAAQSWIQTWRRRERGVFLLLLERLFIRFEADHFVLHPSPPTAQLDTRGLISLLSGALKNPPAGRGPERRATAFLNQKMRKMKEIGGETVRALKKKKSVFTTLKLLRWCGTKCDNT